MIALVCKFELFLSPDAVFLFSFFVQSPDEGADYNDDIKTSQFFVVVFFYCMCLIQTGVITLYAIKKLRLPLLFFKLL